jgi:hypothetical protein
MNDEVRLNHFFSVLREKRKAFADNYAYFAPQLAPRFNSFNFICPDEMKLSKILAMLLNPKGDHAQGDLFLRLFFSEIDIAYPSDTNRIEVDFEVATNKSRRIDIVVTFDNHFGLAIENKPWAYDQNKQLSDYAKHMESKFGENWCLIYLSGTDSNPKEDSATFAQIAEWKSKNQYQKINFRHIVEWLKNCEARCKADHVRHFLRDFIDYCENEFLGETNMVDADFINDYALKDKENLELALAFGQQMNAIKEKLFEKFLKDLESALSVALPDWKFWREHGLGYGTTSNNKVKFRKPEWQNYALAIDFDRNSFYWGIWKRNEKTPDLPKNTIENLNGLLKNKSGKGNSYWSWYCYFPEPYRNWSIKIEPWIAIQSGEMAKMVITEIVKLAEASQDIIDKAEYSILSKPKRVVARVKR